jgi:hypothetical protein
VKITYGDNRVKRDQKEKRNFLTGKVFECSGTTVGDNDVKLRKVRMDLAKMSLSRRCTEDNDHRIKYRRTLWTTRSLAHEVSDAESSSV